MTETSDEFADREDIGQKVSVDTGGDTLLDEFSVESVEKVDRKTPVVTRIPFHMRGLVREYIIKRLELADADALCTEYDSQMKEFERLSGSLSGPPLDIGYETYMLDSSVRQYKWFKEREEEKARTLIMEIAPLEHRLLDGGIPPDSIDLDEDSVLL